MTVRLLSAATALLAGLLAVLLLDLALGSPGALAQERKNCPPGFVWVRWSPNGCSQEKLPPHGYINYDGWGTCEAGYQADIEQRATTDGKPPPGSARTSFPYLKACISSTTGIGGGGFGGTAGDAAEQLYDGGGGPSSEELAAVGVGFGLGFGVATWGTFVLGSPIGAGVWGGPRGPGATQVQSLDEMIADAKKRLERTKRQRDDAYARWRSIKDVLSFYESHHFWGQTGHYARMTAFAIFAAVGAYLLIPAEGLAGAYFAVKGATGLTVIKVGAGGSAGVLTAYSVAQPPADVSEAARWIEKIRPIEERAANKYLSLDAQVREEEHRLTQLEGQKLFSKHLK